MCPLKRIFVNLIDFVRNILKDYDDELWITAWIFEDKIELHGISNARILLDSSSDSYWVAFVIFIIL